MPNIAKYVEIYDYLSAADRSDAVAELIRLADWPSKDWLPPQPDLPANLVDFARHHKSK